MNTSYEISDANEMKVWKRYSANIKEDDAIKSNKLILYNKQALSLEDDKVDTDVYISLNSFMNKITIKKIEIKTIK